MGSLSWLCNSRHNFVCPVEKSSSTPEHVRSAASRAGAMNAPRRRIPHIAERVALLPLRADAEWMEGRCSRTLIFEPHFSGPCAP